MLRASHRVWDKKNQFPSVFNGTVQSDTLDMFLYLDCFFCLFTDTPAAYGSSRARGWIGASAATLHQSLWQHQILNPLNEARDQTCILMKTMLGPNLPSHNGNSQIYIFQRPLRAVAEGAVYRILVLFSYEPREIWRNSSEKNQSPDNQIVIS